jgi:hypothetical protein
VDRYVLENAASKIDGYFLPRESDLAQRHRRAFARAQAECVQHLQAQLAAVAGLSYEKFMAATKRQRLHDAEIAALPA